MYYIYIYTYAYTYIKGYMYVYIYIYMCTLTDFLKLLVSLDIPRRIAKDGKCDQSWK